MQSSPTLSITGERAQAGNTLSGLYPPQIVNTTDIDVTNIIETRNCGTKEVASLFYANSALQTSDEEQNVKETRF